MRRQPARLHRGFIPLVVCAALAGLGCESDNSLTAPSAPSPITPISLSRAWPNANGQSFQYRYNVRTATTPTRQLYPTAAAVPPITLDQIAALLENPRDITVFLETVNGYVLTFLDSTQVGGGVRGQNLLANVTPYPIPVAAAPRLTPAGAPAPPFLLRGGVYRQEANHLSAYNLSGTEPSWTYLAGRLEDRTPWATPLLPGLATGPVLRARAYQSVNVDIAGFRRDNALDVHYLVDFGVSANTSSGGGVLGYSREFLYGRIIWAQDAGPLFLTERQGLSVGDTLSLPAQEVTLLLENVVFPVGYAAAR